MIANGRVCCVPDCRRQLLQTMCKHLQYHISHRQEIRLSTDLLGDLLTSVQQLQVSQSHPSPSVRAVSVSPSRSSQSRSVSVSPTRPRQPGQSQSVPPVPIRPYSLSQSQPLQSVTVSLSQSHPSPSVRSVSVSPSRSSQSRSVSVSPSRSGQSGQHIRQVSIKFRITARQPIAGRLDTSSPPANRRTAAHDSGA